MARVIEFAPGAAATSGADDPILGFFAKLSEIGLKAAIPNLSAQLAVYSAKGTALPLTVSVGGGGACYLASFTRMYMDGAADELSGSSSILLKLFAPGVSVGGHAARAMGMDDIVTVNNNLHATCHAGDWSALDFEAMTAALIAKYPGRAIWVRGLTDRLHAAEIARFKQAGYVVAPSRPVDILDPTESDWKITRHLRKDLSKLNRLPGLTPFIGGTFYEDDFAAMARFSRSATVEHHSALMPHYTAAFFRACAAWADCLFVGLRDGAGRLRGFASTIGDGRTITCGTLGYDLQDEHARLIYPALIVMTMNESVKARRPFNIGYGAAEFKRWRGTTPAMEQNAFYLRHLPALKRGLWQTTTSAMATLAGPVMKRL